MVSPAMLASIRFGLGPRPDAPPPTDPLAWLDAQLDTRPEPTPLPAGWDHYPTAIEGLALLREDNRNPVPSGPSRQSQLFTLETQAHLAQALTSPAPFRERLVDFYANHLTISRREGSVAPLAGNYLRDVIRAHATGRFTDMLLAAEHHPAMLVYLDQTGSVGPNSNWGKRSGRGINENLAREILELHTITPAAGYTQADVTAFAMLLSGLGWETNKDPLGVLFRPSNHEPGPKTVLGRDWPEGEATIDVFLRHLAEHPATQRNLATKLIRHFITDTPDPAQVQTVFAVLRDTGGDLRAAARALIRLPGALDAPLSKLRTPQDFVVAAFRAAGAGADSAPMVSNLITGLNQPLWVAPQPNGWGDTTPDWTSPEAMMQRFDTAYLLAGRFGQIQPAQLLDTALGPLARDETRLAASRAGSVRDGLTLILGSPEFQRR